MLAAAVQRWPVWWLSSQAFAGLPGKDTRMPAKNFGHQPSLWYTSLKYAGAIQQSGISKSRISSCAPHLVAEVEQSEQGHFASTRTQLTPYEPRISARTFLFVSSRCQGPLTAPAHARAPKIWLPRRQGTVNSMQIPYHMRKKKRLLPNLTWDCLFDL